MLRNNINKETDPFPRKNGRKPTLLICIGMLGLLVGVILAVVIHYSNTEKQSTKAILKQPGMFLLQRTVTPNDRKIKIDIVVAYYSHSCHWLNQVANFRSDSSGMVEIRNVYIYCKGQNQHPDIHPEITGKVYYMMLENVGGCDHTYLTHMDRYYDDMPDVLFFLKDTSQIHVSNYRNDDNSDNNIDRIRQIMKTLSDTPTCILSVAASLYTVNRLCPSEVSNYTLDSWVRQSSESNNFTISSNRPLQQWLSDVTTNAYTFQEEKRIRILLGGMFAVSGKRVQRVPRETYRRMIISLQQHGNNSEVEHYVERSYSILFGTLPHHYYTTNTVVVSAHFIGTSSSQEVHHIRNLPGCFTGNEVSRSMMLSSTSWCPHIMYSDSRKLCALSSELGWKAVYVECNLNSHHETNLYAKYYKMKPHKLEEVRAYNPEYVVWMDSTRCMSNKTNICAAIDGLTSSTKAIILMQNFCGGGNNGNIHDELKLSAKQDRYNKIISRLWEFTKNAAKLGLPIVDTDGHFCWCSNIIYNLQHVYHHDITDLWFQLTESTQIIQDQITMHFVHQLYKTSFGFSPSPLFNNMPEMYRRNLRRNSETSISHMLL